MTFASPWMLWSLAALAPLVVAYLLRVRPRRKPTTAWFLWEQVLQQRTANRLWRQLRSLWSLLLVGAAVTAACLALAEPQWGADRRKDLLILVDNSVSMRAREAGGDRLELAKQEARDLARALDGVQRAAVATVAGRLRYASHLTDNPRELIAAIDAIQPTNEAFDRNLLTRNSVGLGVGASQRGATQAGSEAAAETAAGTTEQTTVQSAGESPPAGGSGAGAAPPARRVILVTDGLLGGGDPPAGVELLLVGGPAENVGIVAADAAMAPGASEEMTLYYQVAAAVSESIEIDLLVYRLGDGDPGVAGGGARQLAKVVPLVVTPGVNEPQSIAVDGARPGRWMLELDGERLASRLTGGDALGADNRAWLVVRQPPPIRVAAPQENSYFFQQCVRAFSGPAGRLELVYDDAAVTLAAGATNAERAVIVGPEGDSPWWEGAVDSSPDAAVLVGAARVRVPDHPVLARLDPLGVSYSGARRIKPPVGAEVLVESDDQTPLIYTVSRPSGAAVVVNLDPLASDFYLSAYFPVLMHAAAEYLTGREDSLAAAYRTGDTPRLPGGAEALSGELLTPAGESVPLPVPITPPLAELGHYTAAGRLAGGGERRWGLGCSLLSANETLVASTRDAERPPALAVGSPPVGWLLVLAILAATAESVLYHLRKVG